jgi:hypothetical protein
MSPGTVQRLGRVPRPLIAHDRSEAPQAPMSRSPPGGHPAPPCLGCTWRAPVAYRASDIRQALADIATIGLLQERNVRRSEIAAAQQAKGKLAERLGLNVDDAFRLLRVHARNTNQRPTGTARYVVDHPSADFPPLPRK